MEIKEVFVVFGHPNKNDIFGAIKVSASFSTYEEAYEAIKNDMKSEGRCPYYQIHKFFETQD